MLVGLLADWPQAASSPAAGSLACMPVQAAQHSAVVVVVVATCECVFMCVRACVHAHVCVCVVRAPLA